MTTALFLLRCVELGIAIADLEFLTIGLVLDMFTEKGNDEEADFYAQIADQNAFDNF